MPPEQATIWPQIITALSAITGVVIAGLFNYFTQSSLIRKETRKTREQDLYSKRLIALQNLIYACDWILRMKEHQMIDDFGKSVWDHITKENIANLAFIPKSMETDFDFVIHALFSGHLLEKRADIDYEKISTIKARIQGHLIANYTDKG